MFQHLLTAYLTLTSLVGPGLCCCAISPLAASQPCCHAAPAKRAAHSCCERSSQPGQRSGRPGERPHCPCHSHQTVAALALDGAGGLADLEKLDRPVHAVVTVVATADDGSTLDTSSDSTQVGEHLPLSGRDILRALHVLRC